MATPAQDHQKPYSPNPEWRPACAEFLPLLKTLIGDGDLRETERISKLLNTEVTVDAWYDRENMDHGAKIRGFFASLNTDKYLFQPINGFRYAFLLVHDSMGGDDSPGGGALMRFSFPVNSSFTCLALNQVVAEFGEQDPDVMSTPFGDDFKIIVGRGRFYKTTIGGTISHEKNSVMSLTVYQENTPDQSEPREPGHVTITHDP